jgi:hypothetical protein
MVVFILRGIPSFYLSVVSSAGERFRARPLVFLFVRELDYFRI